MTGHGWPQANDEAWMRLQAVDTVETRTDSFVWERPATSNARLLLWRLWE